MRGHWMHAEPLDRAAWPDYEAETERYGRMAAAAIRFYVMTGNETEARAAYLYARHAARHGNIALFAREVL